MSSATATPVDEVRDVPTLTAQDRCERCLAQAYVRVRLASGAELDFCAHHTREHLPALEAGGAVVVIDDRERLTAKPSL